MFFWHRNIRFVLVREFKRFKRGIFVNRERKTRRGMAMVFFSGQQVRDKIANKQQGK